MAEALLAGKEIEEFPSVNAPANLTLTYAVISKFPHDFFMRDGPGNRRNRKSDYE
jgi:hypothetical protein